MAMFPFGIKVSNFAAEMYLQTLRREVDLERVTALQLARNFPTIHEIRKFNTVFTTARYVSVSSTRLTQPTPSDIHIRSILILSSNLGMRITSGLFPTDFPSCFLSLPFEPHAPVISFSFMESEKTYYEEERKNKRATRMSRAIMQHNQDRASYYTLCR